MRLSVNFLTYFKVFYYLINLLSLKLSEIHEFITIFKFLTELPMQKPLPKVSLSVYFYHNQTQFLRRKLV